MLYHLPELPIAALHAAFSFAIGAGCWLMAALGRDVGRAAARLLLRRG
jgi:hypothetical protein